MRLLLVLLVAFAIAVLLCCVDADPMVGQEKQLVREKRWGYGYGGWGGGGWGGGYGGGWNRGWGGGYGGGWGRGGVCAEAESAPSFYPEYWEQLYNCSRVNIDDVPLWERRQIVNGTVMLILFFIFELLYLPCLIAIWKHCEHSCYKFLFFIGVTDVLMLPIQGLISALYSIFGVEFCSYRDFNFLIGFCAAGLFAAQSSANFFLALDRLVEMTFSGYSKMLFSGRRAWLWTMASSVFGLYYFCFVKPPCFAPTYGNWFMNPYQDYNNITVAPEDLKKKNEQQSVVSHTNNLLFQKASPQNICCPSSANFAKIVFIQVAAINGINVATFVLFSIMQHLPMSKWLIVVGFYCNYLMFGIPPIVYLLVNRTIRNECRKMGKKIIRSLF
uniref:Uncharacterized protein n=1 Tax=Globodera rostochiensis TaxID=31243 RepID=A0A914IEK7_GLORO